MQRRVLALPVLGVLLLCGASSEYASAQEAVATIDNTELTNKLDAAKEKLAQEFEAAAGAMILDDVEVSLPTSPSAARTTAPSSSSATELVDAPSLPTLVSLALENDLATFDDNISTFGLNFFALAGLARPSILDEQERYERLGWLRRLGGSVTLGGEGEKFDRDGDGEAEDPAKSKDLGDIVTVEVQYQIFGSRDRRDRENYSRYMTRAVDEVRTAYDLAYQEALLPLLTQLTAIAGVEENGEIRFDEAKVDQFLTRADVLESLTPAAVLRSRLRSSIEEINEEIDRRPVMTFVVGRTQRKEQFGGDKWKAGLKAAWGTPLGDQTVDHTFNVDWTSTDAMAMLPKSSMLKTGYKLSTLLLKGSALAEEGATLSFSAAGEFYRDVPGAMHDQVVKAGVKLEFPVAKGIRLPISVNYANHRDLLSDSDEVIGHVGFSLDLSEIRKGKSGS